MYKIYEEYGEEFLVLELKDNHFSMYDHEEDSILKISISKFDKHRLREVNHLTKEGLDIFIKGLNLLKENK